MGIKVPTFGIGLLWGMWQNWAIDTYGTDWDEHKPI